MPFYESRESVDFSSYASGLQANETLLTNGPDDWIMAMNVVYNDTETREMHWAVNSRDTASGMSMVGFRCVDGCDLDPVVVTDETQPTMLWSDPATWRNLPNRIPQEGDEVEIMDGWTVIYDIGTSPLFQNVQVNGNLEFKYGQPAILRTYSMWVRAGRVDIGTADAPFDSTVEIRLYGNNTSPSQFVFSQSIPVGTKNLIITGTMNMFGKPRTRMTRLLEPAMPTQTQIIVETGLDWKNGDKLALPATNADVNSSESVIVEDYDAQ